MFAGKGFARVGIALLCAALGPGAGMVRAAADFSAWAHSVKVSFNTTSTGANVAGNVANFPVLIRLNGSNFPFTQAKADGGDLRFADADGTALPYEIERWDPAGKAEIWVRVPRIDGNSAADHILMYWGKSDAVSLSSGGAVFPAADGFGGVWHLGETGGVAADGYHDASSNALHGSGSVMDAASTREATVGRGQYFSGTGSHIAVPANAALGGLTRGFTLSAWVQPESLLTGRIFSADRSVTNNGFGLGLRAPAAGWATTYAVKDYFGTNWGLAAGKWTYLTAVFDSAFGVSFYIDGALLETVTHTVPGNANPDDAWLIGSGKQAALIETYRGLIDEMRVCAVPRGADWIKLSYVNQKGGPAFATWPPLDACPIVFTAPRDTAVNEGASVELIPNVACATGYEWSLVSGPGRAIFDPEAKNLPVAAPRVAGDTAIVYRFTARFSDSARSRDVRVTVKEAIPDPIFTLALPPTWNGRDSLKLSPVITNQAALTASGHGTLRMEWTLQNIPVDTSIAPGALLLRHADASGDLGIRLCVDNGGTAACKTGNLAIAVPTGIKAGERLLSTGRIPARISRDLRGRRIHRSHR